MSTLKATNIKNESSASNNIVLDSGGGVVVSGILTATTFSGNVTGNVTGNVSGNITIGTGSTSAPSLAPSGDSNTGIFFPAADTIAFAEGGAEVARFDSSSRFLIGTSTSRDVASGGPAVVQIEGSNFRHLSLVQNSNDDNGVQLNFGKSRGTTAGGTTIVQNGDDLANIRFAGANGSDVSSSVAAQIRVQVDGTPGVSNDMPGRITFWTTSDGSGSPTERVRILSNGVFKASATGSYINSSSQNYELTNTGNNNILNMYHVDANGGNCGGIYLKYENAAPNNSGLMIRGDDNVAMRFIIRNNGGISNYQANDSNLCDEREKKNIVDLDSTWDCLKHWELKKFHYNEDDNDSDLRYGVIAQQISLHCPEVITEWIKQNASEAVLDEDGNEIEPAKEEIVRLAVKEQQMYWMAIKALQEAQERIETLEAQNAAILARLDAAGL